MQQDENGTLVKLFVGNLSWGVGDDQLRTAFESHGNVNSARVIRERDTGRSRGFGFVEIVVDNVEAVIRETDGMSIDGRAVRVNEAEDKNGARPPRRDQGGGYNRR